MSKYCVLRTVQTCNIGRGPGLPRKQLCLHLDPGEKVTHSGAAALLHSADLCREPEGRALRNRAGGPADGRRVSRWGWVERQRGSLVVWASLPEGWSLKAGDWPSQASSPHHTQMDEVGRCPQEGLLGKTPHREAAATQGRRRRNAGETTSPGSPACSPRIRTPQEPEAGAGPPQRPHYPGKIFSH